MSRSALPRAFTGSGPTSEYIGNDFRNAYVPGSSLTGAGQKIGLFELDGYYASDIQSYAALAGNGRTNIAVQPVLIDKVSGIPGYSGDPNADLEVSLDIELAMAMAPGLTNIFVYEGSTPNNVLNVMAASNTVKNLSSSWAWGGGPSTTTDNILKTMAAQGQSFFEASGDSDAYLPGTADTYAPTTSPYITLVGGTTLTMNGSGASYSSETVWNWGNEIGQNGTGSSGGVSSSYSIPVWQQGINSFLTDGGSMTRRNIPDVALTADNVYATYGNGSSTAGFYLGGTSCAAPLWAGFMALVNQQAATGGSTAGQGLINPAIYEMANESGYNSLFNDITTGDNTWSNSLNAFYAVPNFDLCTGIGTPNGTNLINALLGPDPLVIVSNGGFVATGTPAGSFNISSETFFLTNTSASSLTWSLVSTTAWLSASSGGGTLGAGAGTSLSVSLNNTATNLAAGTYTASLSFSNITSGVGHFRFFVVQTVDPMLLSSNNVTFAVYPGGLSVPASQTVVLTNAHATAFGWSLNNTSAWFNVSPASGTLAGSTATNLAFTLTPAGTNLPAGTSTAIFNVTNLVSLSRQSITGVVLVSSSYVQNGGFETGDFTAWALSGNSGSFGITSSSAYVHSGSYGLQAMANSPGYITQTLPTVPGQTYQLSFWFLVSGTRTGQQVQANWNGTNVYSTTSLPTSWTNQKMIVTATSANTVLQFGLDSGSGGTRSIGLDDISVIPVNLPAITQPPLSQTNLAGSNVTFTVTATGSAPLAFQWRTNGVNLANTGNVSGVATNALTITAITTGDAGNYTVLVTNAYGAVTSSVASLTVVLPPSLTGSVLTNRTLQCGVNTNTFTIAAAGTAPLAIQWSLDASPVSGATNSTFSLTNLYMPNHTVGVVVTNLYGTVASNVTLAVVDTLAPMVTLNGAALMTNELGSAYTDPGATAFDACAGAVSVTTNGSVNVSVTGTNVITYKAGDGNGNTNSAIRTVIVRDTTLPVISWSFTNLLVAANSNCVALLTNVTGTNFIRATDLSGTLTITQSPTNTAPLPIGTNVVVITVADASGNKSFSTNQVVVADQTPPQIVLQPQSQTNVIGANASFSFGATACTPLAYQWYFNNGILAAQTNVTLTLSGLATNATGNYFAVAGAGGGASTSQVATLQVNLIPPGFSSVSAGVGGGFTLNLLGSPGYTYVLLSATNLVTGWLPLATNTLGTNGVWQFTDFGMSNNPDRFYRLMQQ
jgi:hypothetical protein